MAFTLGSAPDTLKVILVQGADFVSALRRKDGLDWPAATQLILEFATEPATNWPATLEDDRAVWNKDQDDVDDLIATGVRKVKLWYVENDLRVLWASGAVEKRRS